MNDDEYVSLLRLLRERTQANGRSDLDELLLESRLTDSEGPRMAVLAYLEGLRDDFHLAGERAARAVRQRLGQFATDTDRQFSGMVIDVAEEDYAAFGVEQVELVGIPGVDEAVGELQDLIDRIAADEDAL